MNIVLAKNFKAISGVKHFWYFTKLPVVFQDMIFVWLQKGSFSDFLKIKKLKLYVKK